MISFVLLAYWRLYRLGTYRFAQVLNGCCRHRFFRCSKVTRIFAIKTFDNNIIIIIIFRSTIHRIVISFSRFFIIAAFCKALLSLSITAVAVVCFICSGTCVFVWCETIVLSQLVVVGGRSCIHPSLVEAQHRLSYRCLLSFLSCGCCNHFQQKIKISKTHVSGTLVGVLMQFHLQQQLTHPSLFHFVFIQAHPSLHQNLLLLWSSYRCQSVVRFSFLVAVPPVRLICFDHCGCIAVVVVVICVRQNDAWSIHQSSISIFLSLIPFLILLHLCNLISPTGVFGMFAKCRHCGFATTLKLTNPSSDVFF